MSAQYSNEEWEKITRKADDTVDKAYEKAIEKMMKLMIERLMRWDDTSAWSKVYKAFYAPQIKILTKLIVTEFKYDPQWTQITQFRHEVDSYIRVMEEMKSKFPDPPFGSRGGTQKGREMVAMMDGMLQGNLNVLNGCRAKAIDMNEWLEVHKPHNLFDFVFGTKTNAQARNGFCDSVKKLISITEDLSSVRNRWAALEGMSPKRREFRQGMQAQCPETIY